MLKRLVIKNTVHRKILQHTLMTDMLNCLCMSTPFYVTIFLNTLMQ